MRYNNDVNMSTIGPLKGPPFTACIACQGPGDGESEAEEDSDSELDEEAALRAYREVERRLKLKRTAKKLQPNEA